MPLHRRKSAPNPTALPAARCAAKTTPDGRPGLSVSAHGVYTAEVARELVRLYPHGIQQSCAQPAVALAAVHDVGKVSPGFQAKIRNPALRNLSSPGLETDHARVGAAAVNRFMGAPKEPCPAARIVGVHHGALRGRLPLTDTGGAFGGPAWAGERRRLIAELVERYGPLPDESITAETRDLIAGIVTVADWIASDEDFFPSEGLPPGTDIAAQAANAVRECGFRTPVIEDGLSFEQVFGFPPFPLQQRFAETATAPGLYILEAPMGTGKTEAALFAAYRLLARGCAGCA